MLVLVSSDVFFLTSNYVVNNFTKLNVFLLNEVCLNLFEHDTVGIILIVPFPVMVLFQSQLDDAIAQEEYEDAVKLKLAIAGATENDIVGTAISTMNVRYLSYVFIMFKLIFFLIVLLLQRAIEEENYNGAAHIRDHAGAGLVG